MHEERIGEIIEVVIDIVNVTEKRAEQLKWIGEGIRATEGSRREEGVISEGATSEGVISEWRAIRTAETECGGGASLWLRLRLRQRGCRRRPNAMLVVQLDNTR